MAPTTAGRKRKAVTRDVPELSDVESEAEYGEAVLSDSEGEDDDEESTEGSDEDELDAEGIPEGFGDAEQVEAANGQKPQDTAIQVWDDEDKPNYTIEKDANGGERYVYQDIDPVVRNPRNIEGKSTRRRLIMIGFSTTQMIPILRLRTIR